MSTLARIGSGTAAAWMRIAIMSLGQIGLIPILLSFWDTKTYGSWLALQAIAVFSSILSTGYQTYTSYELLKIGAKDSRSTSRLLYSSMASLFLIWLVEISCVLLFAHSSFFEQVLGLDSSADAALLDEARWALTLQSLVWIITGGVPGLYVRAVVPFGHYPLTAWYGVLAVILTIAAPVTAVALGGGLFAATATSAACMTLVTLIQMKHLISLLRRRNVVYSGVDLGFGLRNTAPSLAITGRNILNQARQQGIRLILTSLVGVAEMAAFATMRTGANVALQGLGTITSPMEPELLRFIHNRDQARMESSFGLVWIILIGGLCPGIVLIQALMPDLFPIWTRGKFVFDPLLFAMLSAAVLIFAHSQPATTIIRGDNLVISQLIIAIAAAAVTIAGLLLLAPYLGIRAAGLVLLLAEWISLAGYVYLASSWLRERGMQWPRRSSWIAGTAAWTAIGTCAAISFFPQQRFMLFAVCWAVELALLAVFIRQLPDVAKAEIRKLASVLTKFVRPRISGKRY